MMLGRCSIAAYLRNLRGYAIEAVIPRITSHTIRSMTSFMYLTHCTCTATAVVYVHVQYLVNLH